VGGDIGERSEHPPGDWIDQCQAQVVVAKNQIGEALVALADGVDSRHGGQAMREQLAPSLRWP